MRLYTLAAFSLILTACSSVPTYGPVYGPPSTQAKDAARLRVIDRHQTAKTQVVELTKSCFGWLGDAETHDWKKNIASLGGYILGANLRAKLGIIDPPSDNASYTEILVQSGKEFNLGAIRYARDETCRDGISFIPEPGADYEAVMESYCELSLKKLILNEGKITRVPVKNSQLKNNRCYEPIKKAGDMEAPAGRDVAIVNIQNKTSNEMALYTFEDGEKCQGRKVVQTGFGPLNRQNIIAEDTSTSIKIKSGAPFSLNISTSTRDQSWPITNVSECDIVGTFLPEAGASYAVAFSWSGNRCVFSVNRTDAGNDYASIARFNNSVRLRKATSAILNDGSACK